MKKLIFTLLTLFATSTFANTCTVSITSAPGGSLDLTMRSLQKQNKDLNLEYAPGQFSAVAVSKLKQSPEMGMFSNPSMFSTKAPIKDHNLELQSVTIVMDLGTFSTKHSNLEEVVKLKKGNIGLPVLGGPAHFVALELKELNPNLEIVAFGSDAKAIPSIVNGDVDVYITGANSAENFNSLNIKTLTASPEIKVAGKRIRSFTWIGIWVNKSASVEQKENILKCINKSVNQNSINDINTQHIKLLNITDSRKDSYLKDFISFAEKHGL